MLRLFLFLLIALPLRSQPIISLPANQLLSVDAAQEDVHILQKHLRAIHGGLYTYRTPTAVDSFFQDATSRMEDSLRVLDLYRLVGNLPAFIGDAHTSVRLPEAFYTYLDTEMRLLPLGVRHLSGRLYLTINLSADSTIPLGSEILRINGQKTTELFQSLLPYFERDGKNENLPARELSSLFMDYYGFLYEEPDTFTLQLKLGNGAEKQVVLPAEKWPVLEKRVAAYWAERNVGKSPQLPLGFTVTDGAGYLRVSTFNPGKLRRAKQSSGSFFRKVFTQLREKKIDQLVIDLRGNGGGSDIEVITLLRYLLPSPFQLYDELSVASLTVPDHQYYPTDNLRKAEKAARKVYVPVGDRFLDQKSPAVRITEPEQEVFRGKIYVLIDERTASAAGDFCGALQHRGRATFVGRETGGNANVNGGGFRPTLVLPNSGLRVDIPTLRYRIRNQVNNHGFGVRPDHQVQYTVTDIIAGTDLEMQLVRELLKTGN
ncbi:MAG: S41 family peptidase [Bacteroidota bacterium]